jgi:4-hydroxy-tetrahydrodipicolinate reductase
MSTKVILSGCTGSMGKVIIDALKGEDSLKIVAGVCTSTEVKLDFPVYNRFSNIVEESDMIIDFSNKYLLDDILEYADRKKLKLVLASTGYSKYDEEKIFAISKKVAVFRSSNMSYGVHLMIKLTEYAVKLLGENYEIEIVEEHGGKKIDAPSGTTKMILSSIKNNVDYNLDTVYNREGVLNGRKKTDIGIHSIRGGGLLGNHTVMFVGDGDIIKIEHNTLSKEIYAKGAINAAKFIVDKNKGYFKFEDLV